MQDRFTLLELLITVAVLTILIALLLPGLHKAREKARNITCVNNLKQLYLAQNGYASDYEWYCPGEMQTVETGNAHRMAPKLRPYLGMSNAPFKDFPDLHQLMTKPPFLCPSQTDRAKNTISYAPNSFKLIYDEPGKTPTGIKPYFSWHYVARPDCRVPGYGPSRVFFLMEIGYLISSPPEQKESPRCVTNGGDFANGTSITPDWRHAGSKNSLMMDGSIRNLRYAATYNTLMEYRLVLLSQIP